MSVGRGTGTVDRVLDVVRAATENPLEWVGVSMYAEFRGSSGPEHRDAFKAAVKSAFHAQQLMICVTRSTGDVHVLVHAGSEPANRVHYKKLLALVDKHQGVLGDVGRTRTKPVFDADVLDYRQACQYFQDATAAAEPKPKPDVFSTGIEILVPHKTSVARTILPYVEKYVKESGAPVFGFPTCAGPFYTRGGFTAYSVEILTYTPKEAFAKLVELLAAAPWCAGTEDHRSAEPVPLRIGSVEATRALKRQFNNRTEIAAFYDAKKYNARYGDQDAT